MSCAYGCNRSITPVQLTLWSPGLLAWVGGSFDKIETYIWQQRILTWVQHISTSTVFCMTHRFTFTHAGIKWIVLIISQWIIQCNRIKTISHTIIRWWFCSFNLWYIKLFVWINQPLPVGTNISFTCTYIYVHMAVIIVLLSHWSVQKPTKAWCIVNSPGHILQIWLLCFIQN